MKFLILFFLLFSVNSFANEELKNVMKNYLQALKNKNSDELKKSVSSRYYKFLKDSNLLEQALKKQTPGKFSTFDFTFKPLAKEKEAFFVNIKDPKAKNYSDYWFVLRKINGKFVIDSSVFLD